MAYCWYAQAAADERRFSVSKLLMFNCEPQLLPHTRETLFNYFPILASAKNTNDLNYS